MEDSGRATEIPDVLYHYCGVEAFRGIIISGKLWLSNIYWMNDYKEFRSF